MHMHMHSFFEGQPMVDFGSHPLAFACYFDERRAVEHLLRSPRTAPILGNLNNPALRCRRSGFLPIHAAVAGGSPAMYSFLVTLPGVPHRLLKLANPSVKTRPAGIHQLKLTALQLAFWRGDAPMVRE